VFAEDADHRHEVNESLTSVRPRNDACARDRASYRDVTLPSPPLKYLRVGT
jgi:hypothetical protein